MSTIKDLERLKKQIENLKDDISQAKGARDEALRNLKEEFDVKDLAESKKLLIRLTKEEEENKTAFEEALEEFNEKWGDEING